MSKVRCEVMHRALLVPEVLYAIFVLVPGDDSSPLTAACPKVTLAALARTCKVFTEEALNILWAELSDLSPLVRCLPEDSWTCTHGDDGECYSFMKLLKEQHWATIRGYTRRVRALTCAPHTPCLDRASVVALCCPLVTLPLFPNLQRLRWHDRGKQIFPFIHHFVGPKLTHLDFDCDVPTWGVGELSVLVSLPRLCPDLKTVALPRGSWPELCSAVSDTLCGWALLKTVHCDYLNESALRHLGRVQSLEELSLMLGPQISAHSVEKLHNNFAELVSEYLVDAGGTRRELHAEVARVIEETQSVSCNPNHLHEIHVVPYDVIDFPESLGVLTLADFSPLKRFAHLTVVRIDIGYPICLSGEDFLDLTSAWPLLQCLFLNELAGWRTTPTITPMCLVKLARKCRFLHTLGVAVDTIGFDSIPSDRPSLGYTNGAPFILNVLDSPIEDSSITPPAALSSDLYPSLQSIDSWASHLEDNPGASHYTDLWLKLAKASAAEHNGHPSDVASVVSGFSIGNTPDTLQNKVIVAQIIAGAE
ncbi:hypothetical protein HYDPIDRAFT_30580 [Hydnomerulius pinastri MD-312]|uniref:F-box domain-containing protein n=1 Tax=Hydnomerulius pinastri MD-312 TaxID=994086 RepID=A0A0C9VVZ0_9AGAM|nr:hypothetical protein HYDPIDRAFT_30580 [Hydnomerulius pinastri MD-312]